MASISRLASGSWQARWRDPAGKQCKKSFSRKSDAKMFLTSVESSKMQGAYVDPMLGRVTVGEWSERWVTTQVHLKPSTRERYAGIVRSYVVPQWGRVRLAEVAPSDVQAWVSELGEHRSPRTVHKVHRVLSLIMAMAVTDKRIARNPATHVKLPQAVNPERHFLSHAQVQTLAEKCGPYRIVVLFLAYTGTRFGEMAAMRVSNLDLLRRRAEVNASVTEVNGKLTFGTPKNGECRRVPIPRFLVEDLARHVEGKGRDDLVFSAVRGGVLRVRNFRRDWFDLAVAEAGPDGFHPHALRHTAASLAIASGANVKVVQRMLGHKSATMTLDLYGHMFPDQLDEVADGLDAAARESGVPGLRPLAPVTPIDEHATHA